MSARLAGLAIVCAAWRMAVPAAVMAQPRPEPPRFERIAALPLLPELPGLAPRVRDATPGAAFLASAILPGAGQYLLDADRWVPYVALELWGWVSYIQRRNEAHDLEGRYRDLAWSVARRVSVGPRRDSVFEYYETMGHFSESGALDVDPGAAGIQPERDATTFNGDLWMLARALFIPGGLPLPPDNPDYQRALAYYQTHAIPPSFSWAWGDSNLEQQVFAGLIRESDDAFRDATRMLGIILANHALS
ncbi:MAG: hypothetical protein ACRELX_18495, partial [Longimicrobiales bacterium]